MSKLLEEIKLDVNFVKSHTLQPKWYKVLKVFILAGFLVGYGFLFGLIKTTIFFAIFIFLSFLMHMLYRIKTNKWKRSWLDFVVVEENSEIKAKSIGKFYYSAVVLNAILALVISQFIP
jgi:Ca2+-dependent lipid-binding protein